VRGRVGGVGVALAGGRHALGVGGVAVGRGAVGLQRRRQGGFWTRDQFVLVRQGRVGGRIASGLFSGWGALGEPDTFVPIAHRRGRKSMPLQNRVTPFGDLIATPQRGTLMGNRGCLHNDQRKIRRRYVGKRWIACVLEFRGRRRTVMAPNRYTELFFL